MSASSSFFADTPVGRLINNVSSGSLLRKPDQVKGFTLPQSIAVARKASNKSDDITLAAIAEEKSAPATNLTTAAQSTHSHSEKDVESVYPEGKELERALSAILPEGTTLDRVESQSRGTPFPHARVSNSDTIIVGWYGDDDAENPVNWSQSRKIIVTVCICILTFSVYAGSSIATPGIGGMIEEYNVSLTKGTLTLSVFIMGYAVGPLLLAPPSDSPTIGRSTPYWTSMLALVLFNVGAAKAETYGTHIAMRLLAGMAGSPALATGGATLGDVWQGLALPKAISVWAIGAVCGPVLAPVIAGWAAQNVSWRLPLYLFVALSGFGLIVTLFFLPETLSANILYRRAQRLRKLTGNKNLKSQGEIDQAAVSRIRYVARSLYMPLRISMEPIVLYSSVLLGLIYAIFYCAFESVPIIYGEIYHFNTGEQALPFLALGVFGLIGLGLYLVYLIYWFDPRFMRKVQKGVIDPEDRVILALITAPLVLLSLLWTGWTAKASISYWSPLIAQGLYVIPVFYLFQSVLTYLAFAYPEHQASVMSANDLIRSLIASAFPIFARPLFLNLGLGKGYTLLAGLSLALMLPLYGLFKYGHVLRRYSKFAHVYEVPQA
jgi:DHA1 family multidrug resistance protein-like MFS transporter